MLNKEIDKIYNKINSTQLDAERFIETLKTMRYELNELEENGFVNIKDIYDLLNNFEKYISFDEELNCISTSIPGIITQHKFVCKVSNLKESEIILKFFIKAFKDSIDLNVNRRKEELKKHYCKDCKYCILQKSINSQNSTKKYKCFKLQKDTYEYNNCDYWEEG